MTHRIYLVLTLLLLTLNPVQADWEQYRGPNAQGISSESVPTEWSATQNMLWQIELMGQGSSSPIISGDSVFVTSYSGEGADIKRHLTRLSLATGDIVWTKAIPIDYPEDPAQGFIMEHGWASNTPVTDGTHVYCYFGKAGVHAFDFDGNVVWDARTGPKSSGKAWGSGSSPILSGDLLIVPAGDEMRTILALEKESGEVAWKFEDAHTEQTYGTPILAKIDDTRTDLVFAATERWIGLNPKTGEKVWHADYNLPGNMSNTTHLANGILTISGGFPRNARVALKTGGTGDLSDQLLYDTQKPTSYLTAPVEHEGILYWVSDKGIAFAAEPGEAEPIWMERIPNLDADHGKGKPFYAPPILANGKIYAVSRANGTFVIEPSTEELSIIAQNKIEGDTTQFNAAPAVSQRKLLIRSQSKLYCIGE